MVSVCCEEESSTKPIRAFVKPTVRNKIKFRHSFVSAQVFGLPSSTGSLGFPNKDCDTSYQKSPYNLPKRILIRASIYSTNINPANLLNQPQLTFTYPSSAIFIPLSNHKPLLYPLTKLTFINLPSSQNGLQTCSRLLMDFDRDVLKLSKFFLKIGTISLLCKNQSYLQITLFTSEDINPQKRLLCD